MNNTTITMDNNHFSYASFDSLYATCHTVFKVAINDNPLEIEVNGDYTTRLDNNGVLCLVNKRTGAVSPLMALPIPGLTYLQDRIDNLEKGTPLDRMIAKELRNAIGLVNM